MTDVVASPDGRRRAAVRLFFGLGDQGLTALLSFVVVAGASRMLSAHDLGAFALLNGTYVVLQSIEQAIISEAVVVAHSAVERQGTALVRAGRQAVLLNLVLSAAGLGMALAFHLSVEIAAEFGLVCLCALSFDALRGYLITTGQAARAFAASATGLLLLFVGISLLSTRHTLDVPLFFWGVATAAACVVALPRPRRLRALVRRRREPTFDATAWDVQRTLLAEAALATAGQYIGLIGVDAFASRAEAGSLRLSLAVVGPISVLFNVIRLYGVAEIARHPHSPKADRHISHLTAVLCVVGVLVVGVPLLLIPQSWGEHVLGASWAATATLLPWAIGQRAAIGLTLGPAVVLRARRILRGPLLVRVVSGVCAIGGAAVGADLAGAAGALAGLTASALVQWVGLLIVLRRSP